MGLFDSGWYAAKRETSEPAQPQADAVNHPPHYTSHPARCDCGAAIEAIQIIEWLPANVANVVKYCWRQGLKTRPGEWAIDSAIEDMRKAVWYAQREIRRLESMR